MTTPVTCWINVEDGSGNKLGDGPLRQIVSWSSTSQLSQAGTFAATVAAADPRCTLLQPKRVLRCYALFRGVVTEIGAGIIDQIDWSGGDTVVVTGSDLLIELTYRSVRDLKLYTETTHVPTKVLWWDGATYHDLPDCYDGVFTNSDSFNLAATNSFLYIGYSAPFNILYAHQGVTGPNTVPSTLNYGYSDGAGNWPELDVVSDTQIVGGVPWPASLSGNDPPNDGTGTVLFQRNANWAAETVNGVSAYWVRVDPSEDIDSVTIEEFVIGTRSALAADVAAVMAFAPSPAWDDWADDADSLTIFDSTTDGTYAVFAGESVLNALIKLADRADENFRLGPGRALHWLRSYNDSGVRAVRPTGNERLDANSLVCQVVSLDQIYQTSELVTRVYPYGAGNGAARVSLINATLAMPSGYSMSTVDNYIENTTAAATYGQIERVLAFKDVRSTDDLTYDTVEVCDELAQLALTHLQKNSAVQEYYRLSVAGLHELLQVGTTVRLIWREVHDGVVTKDIDGDYIILGVTHTFAAGQLFTASLDVATVDQWPVGDDETLANTVEDGIIYEAHGQPIMASMVRGLVGEIKTLDLSGSHTHDHGSLSGLGDDDHAQYLLAATYGGRTIFGAAWTDLTDAGATTLHKHSHANLDDLTTGDPHTQYVLETDYEDADVLAKLLNVDGTGTGLDADLLDGNHAAAFALLASAQEFSAAQTIAEALTLKVASTNVAGKMQMFNPGSITRYQLVRIDLTYASAIRNYVSRVDIALGRNGNASCYGVATGYVMWQSATSTNNGTVHNSSFVTAGAGTEAVAVTAIANGIRIEFSSTDWTNTLDSNAIKIENIGDRAASVTVTVAVA